MINKISTHYSKLDKKDKDGFIYFVHCREPYEIQKFVDFYNDKCVTILIKKEDRDVPDNMADKNVNNFNYHYIIKNDGSIV
jgi:hypothetical protein